MCRIPFMVIESAKTEYRALKVLRNDASEDVRRFAVKLELYTVGVEHVSPFRLNPFEIPPKCSREEHIETLCACFEASMPLSGPLPALIRQGLVRLYALHPDPDNPPVMADFLAAIEEVLAEKRYSDSTNADVRAALDVRLSVFAHGLVGAVFQSRRSIPSIAHLMTTQSIIELDRLPSQAASLFTFFLLTWIRQYLKALPPHHGVRLVIIIEEAHNLVARVAAKGGSEDSADTVGRATEFVCRMLAELRALGVAIVIVDQLPSAVAPEVVALTGSKLTFRLVSTKDREDLGAAMLFGDVELEETARLPTGEAYLLADGYHGPRRIKTTNLHAFMDLSSPPVNETILPYLVGDQWYRDAFVRRRSIELNRLRQELDGFDSQRAAVMRRHARLLLGHVHALQARGPAQHRRALLRRLGREAASLRKSLSSGLRVLREGSYRELLGPDQVLQPDDVGIGQLREALARRFERVIERDTHDCIKRLDCLVTQCAWQA